MNQNSLTINQLLTKDVNIGIISNINLSHMYQTVDLLGSWQDFIENSQIVYGITEYQLCYLGQIHNEAHVLFKKAKKDFQVINTDKGYTGISFNSFKILPNDTKEKNYSEFDGIKFQLTNN